MFAWWRCTMTRPTPMTKCQPWLFPIQSTRTRTLPSVVHLVSAYRHIEHPFWLKSELCPLGTVIHMRSWFVRFSLAITLSIFFIFHLSHLQSHSVNFFRHLKFVHNLRIPPRKSIESLDDSSDPDVAALHLQSGFPRTPSTIMPLSRICCLKFKECMSVVPSEKVCLSVNRRRLCPKEPGRLVGEKAGMPSARHKITGISIQRRDQLSGRLQELQNEVNCMNDSKNFQDAESVRSGNSHVTSRPVSFPPHLIPEGMLECRRREGPPSIWDTHGISGNDFANPHASSSAPYPQDESMEFVNRGAAPFIQSGEKWKTRTRPRSEMPVRTVSQKFSHLQWRRLFKEMWGRPTTSADFGSSFWQVPYTSYVCVLEDKVQDRGLHLFTISYGSDAMDERSGVGWFSGWIEIFVIYSWYFNAEFWSTWCEDCLSTEQDHPKFPFQKENQFGGTKGLERGPFPSRQTDCRLDTRLLSGHWEP